MAAKRKAKPAKKASTAASENKATKARKPARSAKPIPVPVPPFRLSLNHNPEKYLHHHRHGARISYMLFLMILTVCNFLIFIGLVPLLIFIKTELLMLILAGIGLIFGMLFLYLVKDIEHLEPKHHIFAALYIPALSILNIIVLILIGRLISTQTDFQDYTIAYASAIYVAMFLLPYALEQVFRSLFKRKT